MRYEDVRDLLTLLTQPLASKGAEKPCRPMRRKRGLRKGACRSRGRHPRRTITPATVSKEPNARRVNHIGRKYVWAVERGALLLKKGSVYSKKFVESRPSYEGWWRQKRQMERYLSQCWFGAKKVADSMGIPPVVAFSTSAAKFFSWAPFNTSVQDLLDLAEVGIEFQRGDHAPGFYGPSLNTTSAGGRPLGPRTKMRACRACGSVHRASLEHVCPGRVGPFSQGSRKGRSRK